MLEATSKSKYGALEEPILVFLGAGIADREFDYFDLVVSGGVLAKCILAIPLFEHMLAFDHHAYHEPDCVRMKNMGLLFRLFPNVILMVTKYNNA